MLVFANGQGRRPQCRDDAAAAAILAVAEGYFLLFCGCCFRGWGRDWWQLVALFFCSGPAGGGLGVSFSLVGATVGSVLGRVSGVNWLRFSTPSTTAAIHEFAVFPEKMRVRKRILNNHRTV